MFNSYTHLNTVLLLDHIDPVYRSTSIKEYLNALREIFIPTAGFEFKLFKVKASVALKESYYFRAPQQVGRAPKQTDISK